MLSRRQKEQRRPRGNFWQFQVERTDLRWIPLSTAEPRLSKFKRRQICDTSQPFWTFLKYVKTCQNVSLNIAIDQRLWQTCHMFETIFVTFCHDILMPWSSLISPGSCSGEETPGQGRGTQQQQQRIDASTHRRIDFVLFCSCEMRRFRTRSTLSYAFKPRSLQKHMKTTRFCSTNAGSRGCPTGRGCQGERWCAKSPRVLW